MLGCMWSPRFQGFVKDVVSYHGFCGEFLDLFDRSGSPFLELKTEYLSGELHVSDLRLRRVELFRT